MKLLVVGDTVDPQLYDHFRRSRFPEDIRFIVSVGDLPAWYLAYLMSVFDVPLYYVRGNHDFRFDENPPEGAENLDGRIVSVSGLNVLGFEGSMYYQAQHAVQRTEREMWLVWQKVRPQILLRRRVDIVVAHAPPFGIHDGEDECHRGFLTFSKLIHRYRPRFFIHGHTHLNYGYRQKRVDVVNHTTVVNGYGYYVLNLGIDDPPQSVDNVGKEN